MRMFLFFSMAMLWSINSFARQFEPIYRKYDWEDAPKLSNISPENEKASAVIVKDFKGFEYSYDANANLIMYALEHRIIRVNSDKGIEQYNKLAIPMWNVSEIVALKARMVRKDGQAVELDPNNIKEIRDEETGGVYKILAVEGVEIGGEIEYFFVLRMSGQGTQYGSREFYQYEEPVMQAKFELISPENLEFKAKSYNGFPQPQQEVKGGRRFITAAAENIEPIKNEEFAQPNANRMRVEFKIAYNHSVSPDAIYTWQDAAERVYGNLHGFTKEELKQAGKLYKSLKVPGKAGEKERVRAIENYLKSEIILSRGYEPELTDIIAIAQNKYANENGIMRMYAALFKTAKVPYEVVLTSTRSDVRFDGGFDSWKYLSNYAFYFPGSKQYLSPTNIELRYGMLPYDWTHNYGLFIKGENEDNVAGEIRFIEALPSSATFDNLSIDIQFASDMSKADFKLKSEIGGYTASAVQPYYPFIPADKMSETLKSLIERYVEGSNITKISAQNGERHISPLDKPFVIMAEGSSDSFAERAGNKFLFKIGENIGPQTEMYQVEKRQQQVENDFNRLYDRTLTFNVPAGYQVKNLDDLNMNVVFDQNGRTVCNFQSSYVQEGDKVKVRILEAYNEINSDLAFFEDFRKVINAAADFNKIVLVIEKQ